MQSLYTNQSSNIQKTWLLMVVFLGMVIGIGYILAQAFGNSALLYGAVFFAVFMNFVSWWFSDKIVVRMTNSKAITKEQAPELWRLVENLSITAGMPMPKIYIMNEEAPNAFATGRSPEKGVVAVTTGLLKILNRQELEGVIAHELSHITNRDTLVSTVAVVLAGFVSIVADWFFRASFLGGASRSNEAGGNLVGVVVGIALMVLAPLFATLLRMAISRKREFLADASGALLTRYPEGLASALQKISNSGRRMKTAHQATAHLFIANPFGSGASLTKLFSSHPPVAERLKALRGMQ